MTARIRRSVCGEPVEETSLASTPVSVLALRSSVVEVRRAVLADLAEIVALLADDPLGTARDGVTDDEDVVLTGGRSRSLMPTLRSCWSWLSLTVRSWGRCS